MNLRAKTAIAVAGSAVLIAASVFYVVQAKANNPGQQEADASVLVDRGQPAVLTEPGRLVFRNDAPGPDHGKVASVAVGDPGGARRVSGLACERFYVTKARGLCLANDPGAIKGSVASFVDGALAEVKRVDVAGVPNRAKLSPDGRMASWTTFAAGDSYAQPGSFSTRTAIMDREKDELSANIEGILLFIDGTQHLAQDVNYWGVTFASDNRTFYATVGSGGKTYLVKGDNEAWRVESLRENVECPSLSPDGTKIAFKKRVEPGPWREHVLDLTTMKETPLAETRSVDDQAVWLDDQTIAYSLPRRPGGVSDIWASAADGSGTPRLLVSQAFSPSVTS
ncbi:TolB family protein [Amycolatopsis sp. cg5]|uniref:TolB family protein n=1 Tax=Amycolatopsis sp. cg5 TaxID=3238802 RepID=UPI00352429B8